MNSYTSIFKELENEIKKERISACIIYKESEISFQYYKNTKSETKLFKINSVTKSILSILIGIAIDKGIIESVQTPISVYFPSIDQSKKDITIEHLLTMTAGYEWPEWGEWNGRPFPMINSMNWVNYILERKFVANPGEKMNYDSGASQLLSAILQKATKNKLSVFAENMLFKPLGINEYLWHEDSMGINIGGFGLSLTTNDMLKIGILMMQKGIWLGKQVVSSEWVEQSTSAKFHTYDHVGSYGYHWWVLLNDELKINNPPIFFAMGYGGQYIIISPEQNLVVAFNCAKYIDSFIPLKLFRKYFQR